MLMLLTQNVWVLLLPPLLAAVPTALLTMRSSQTIRIMTPKLNRAYIGATFFSCAVIASFVFLGNDLSFKLQFARVLLMDAAILWLATIVGVQVADIQRQQ